VHVADNLFDSLRITDRYLEEAIELCKHSEGSEEEYWVAEDAVAATTKEATRRNEKNEKTEKTEKMKEEAKRNEKSEMTKEATRKDKNIKKTKEATRRNEKTATTKEATRREKNVEKTKEVTIRNEKTATTKEGTRRDKNIKTTKEVTRRNEKTATKKDETTRDKNTETARNGKAEIRGGENYKRRTTEKGEWAWREGIGVVEPNSGVTTGLMSDVRTVICYCWRLERGTCLEEEETGRTGQDG